MFNIKQGIGSEQDTLPHRFFEPMPAGPIKGKRIDPEAFQKAVSLYYEMAGWDSKGVPTAGKLADLGLEWLL
jgi:aldehyde:ferredoxin oxidoreductase